MLGWRPKDLWAATPREYSLALEGTIEVRTGKSKKNPPMNHQRLMELMAKERAT